SRSFPAACSRRRGASATTLARMSAAFTASAAGRSEPGPRLGHRQPGAGRDGVAVLHPGGTGHDRPGHLDPGRPAGAVDVGQRPGDAAEAQAVLQLTPAVEDAADADADVAR